MFTGYFTKLKTYEQNGLIPVAICGKTPSWYNGLWYKKLAPKWTFFNEWKNGTEHKGDNSYYIQHFNDEVLKDKTCRQVLADLQKLTGVKTDFSKIQENGNHLLVQIVLFMFYPIPYKPPLEIVFLE